MEKVDASEEMKQVINVIVNLFENIVIENVNVEKEDEINRIKNFLQVKYPVDGYMLYDEEIQIKLLKMKADENDAIKSNITKKVVGELRPQWEIELEDKGIEKEKIKNIIDKQLVKPDSRYSKILADEISHRLTEENPLPSNETNEIKKLEIISKETTDEGAKKKINGIINYKKTAMVKGKEFANRMECINKNTFRRVKNNREKLVEPMDEETQTINSMEALFDKFGKKLVKGIKKTFGYGKDINGERPGVQANRPRGATGVRETLYKGKLIKTSWEKELAKSNGINHYCKYHRYNDDHGTKECEKFSAFVDEKKAKGEWKEPVYSK